MKISVIIPIYNVEKYLARCLDSIVNQTFRDIEIICINDGSTDNSAEVAKQYAEKDSRISLINQENKGVSATRNAGMEIACGKYISFVDGDDWIDLDFLEKLYNAAESSGADAACAEIKRPHASGRNPYKLKFESSEELSSVADKFKTLEIPRKCYACNKIYLLSELERQNFKFIEGKMFEDIYFTPRFLFNCKKVVTVPGVCYHYWVNERSITQEMCDKNQIDLLAARADLIKFLRKNHIVCDERYYIKSVSFYRFFGIKIFEIREWETIKKYYLFGIIPFFEKRVAL